MTEISEQDFNLWLRPRDALAKLGEANELMSKKELELRIQDGRIPIAARALNLNSRGLAKASEPILIDLAYFNPPWIADWTKFWLSGRTTFTRDLQVPYGSAVMTVVGQAMPNQLEIHDFSGARLDPDAFAKEFDVALDPSPGREAPQQETAPSPRKGGRPAGKHGAPIASITKRLLEMSPTERSRYTAEALSVELRDEFRRHQLEPPSEANARRDAGGILSVVRND